MNPAIIYQMGQIHNLLSLLVIIYFICSIIFMYKYTIVIRGMNNLKKIKARGLCTK